MAHLQQQNFCFSVKGRFPDKFVNCSVLDMGSLDINGSNRYLFQGDYEYVGIDIVEGSNVDFVGKGHEYTRKEKFDVCISTEAFEHDAFWRQSFLNMYCLLKPGGLLLFTCASTGRHPHGTSEYSPQDSPGTNDYYENRTAEDFYNVFNMKGLFSEHYFEFGPVTFDLYFYGIK